MLPNQHDAKDFRQHWEHSLLQAHLPTTHRENVYALLRRAYAEPQRYYHTQQHIVECLGHFHQIQHIVHDPLAVEIAIWFHDLVYDPKALDNELQSAELMKQVCQDFLPMVKLEKIYAWILATQKHQASKHLDLNFLLDIDLAILGSDPQRFAEYERQIQREYAWVDPDIYQLKRKQVLKQFNQMNPIFHTHYFYQRFEQQAKINLEHHV